MRGFGSDNHSGVHPEILKRIIADNVEHQPSYGLDETSDRARNLVRELFGSSAQPFFVFNGTAANVLCLKACVQSYHSVVCSDAAHMNMDECGAPEAIVGCKLIPVPSPLGKLTPELIEDHLIRLGDQHFSQCKMVSITQPTELGTLYSLKELRELRDFTRRKNLMLHIDGARLIYAAASLGVSFQEITGDLGIDALSFGGTKNGMLCGEMVILFQESLAKDFKFLQKQLLQLSSKTRFFSGQFLELLNPLRKPTPIWQEIALHGLAMAQYLEKRLIEIPEVSIAYPVQSNVVFAKIPKAWLKPLREKFFFYVWDEKEWIVRWMMSFDIQKQDLDQFVDLLKTLRA